MFEDCRSSSEYENEDYNFGPTEWTLSMAMEVFGHWKTWNLPI